MKKILAIVLAVIVIAAGAGYFVWESQSYVARIGNHKIKNHEYIFFLRAQKLTTETEAGVSTEQEIRYLWETPVEGEDPKIIVMNQALENAKEFKIQLIQAEREGFRLSDTDKKEILNYLNTSLQNSQNVNYVRNALGLTLPQFRDMMLKSETVNRYANDYMQKNRETIVVTDEEIQTYYQENRTTIDEVTVSHLLISTEQAKTDEQKQEKKALAESLLQRIEQGESMATLIQDYSDDTSSKDNGGLYTFTYAEMEDQEYTLEFGDWAFGSEPGDLVLLESQYGLHIVKLEAKKGFEAKKETMKSAVKAEKLNEFYYSQVQEWNRDPAFNLVKNEKILKKITDKTFMKNSNQN